jgi:hypothetical protein
MQPLIAFHLWQGIDEYRQAFEPPVGNKVIWEDSQFIAMIIRSPHARRDVHVDPSDEIFYMLKGDMIIESMQDGMPQTQIIRRRPSSRAGPDAARATPATRHLGASGRSQAHAGAHRIAALVLRALQRAVARRHQACRRS